MATESSAAAAPSPWRRLLVAPWRAFLSFQRHDGSQHAAAIAYYALLSFLPFIVLLASFASTLLAGRAEDVRSAIDALRPLLPAADERTWARVAQFVEGRSVVSVTSILMLSWLASHVTASTKKAIVAVFGGNERRGAGSGVLARLQAWFVTLTILVALGLVFVGVGIFEYVVATAPGDVVGAGFLRSAGLRRDIVPFVVSTLIALVVYASLPPRRLPRRYVFGAALLAGVLHAVATRMFVLFVALATRRDLIYGSFVGIVSFTAWFYIAAAILLFCAELVAELEPREAREAEEPAIS